MNILKPVILKPIPHDIYIETCEFFSKPPIPNGSKSLELASRNPGQFALLLTEKGHLIGLRPQKRPHEVWSKNWAQIQKDAPKTPHGWLEDLYL